MIFLKIRNVNDGSTYYINKESVVGLHNTKTEGAYLAVKEMENDIPISDKQYLEIERLLILNNYIWDCTT